MAQDIQEAITGYEIQILEKFEIPIPGVSRYYQEHRQGIENLHGIFNSRRNRPSSAENMAEYFPDLAAGWNKGDICLALMYMLTFGEEERPIEYLRGDYEPGRRWRSFNIIPFKAGGRNKDNVPELAEHYKLLLAAALIYNESFFTIAVNSRDYIRARADEAYNDTIAAAGNAIAFFKNLAAAGEGPVPIGHKDFSHNNKSGTLSIFGRKKGKRLIAFSFKFHEKNLKKAPYLLKVFIFSSREEKDAVLDIFRVSDTSNTGGLKCAGEIEFDYSGEWGIELLALDREGDD
jgi:hypothetical protein